jgi:hypothetical protein
MKPIIGAKKYQLLLGYLKLYFTQFKWLSLLLGCGCLTSEKESFQELESALEVACPSDCKQNVVLRPGVSTSKTP